MKFVFTHHAQFRIFTERHITVADIKTTIKNPDGIRYEAGGLIKCRKKLDGGELVVLYSKGNGDTFVIVTAYFK